MEIATGSPFLTRPHATARPDDRPFDLFVLSLGWGDSRGSGPLEGSTAGEE